MLKINVVAVGKVKETYFKEAIKEYEKRLSRFCDFKLIEVQEENFLKVTSSEINLIKEKEAENLMPHLKGKVVVMAIEGKKLSSEDLAKKILSVYSYNSSNIVFVIGGSLGLGDEVLKVMDYHLCFSKMTFPHQLMQVILLEQIYRSFKINNNETYHK